MPAPKTVAAGSAGLLALAVAIATPGIQSSEGRRNVAYYDIAKVLTVCDGHTGRDIVVKRVYSDSECNAMTTADAAKAAKGVTDVSPQLIFHPYVLASMISFTYNLGAGTYAKSSIARLMNKGEFYAGCSMLPLYNHAGGRVVRGLTIRRNKEKDLCLSTLTPSGLGSLPSGSTS